MLCARLTRHAASAIARHILMDGKKLVVYPSFHTICLVASHSKALRMVQCQPLCTKSPSKCQPFRHPPAPLAMVVSDGCCAPKQRNICLLLNQQLNAMLCGCLHVRRKDIKALSEPCLPCACALERCQHGHQYSISPADALACPVQGLACKPHPIHSTAQVMQEALRMRTGKRTGNDYQSFTILAQVRNATSLQPFASCHE